MNPRPRAVEWRNGESVTSLVYGEGEPRFIFAHGAGASQRHELIAEYAMRMAQLGVTTATFDYPFTEAGRRRPDHPPVLLACHAAVVTHLSPPGNSPFLGGRSMGGRIASMLVGGAWEGTAVDAAGLVLHAYPLHPAGRPDRLRIDHLDHIRMPLLVVRGTRDAFSTGEQFDRHIRGRAGVDVLDLEGVDHSFRGSAGDRLDLLHRLAADTVDWMRSIESVASPTK